MAITPRLLTSECTAHYPRLWNLIEQSSGNRDARRYPILLNMIAFCQEFEAWVVVNTDHISIVLDEPVPEHASIPTYGSNPLVELRLEWFADHIGAFVLKQEEIAVQMLTDLADWHNAILQRTTPASLPKHNARKRCPECEQYSVMQYEQDYFCVNQECQWSWSA